MTDQIPDLEWDPDILAAPLEALLLMATEPMPAEELARAVDAPVPVVTAATTPAPSTPT